LLVLALGGFVYVRLTTPDAPPRANHDVGASGGTLRALLRNEPTGFNRYLGQPDDAQELLSHLLHARLVRVNRMTDALEPRLAEGWTEDADGLTYTLALRQNVTYSDGTPFTSADVLFAFEAIYSDAAASVIGDALTIGGRRLEVTAPDTSTVRIRFPSKFGPGLRILDNLPILPRHRLEPALRSGRFKDAWSLNTPPAEMSGLGPFILQDYQPGRTLTLARNPRPRTFAAPCLTRSIVTRSSTASTWARQYRRTGR
jgi:peptide/nickel transport system substrate-binding protein